jgi:hypothetical protein
MIQRATAEIYSQLLIQMDYVPPSTDATRVNKLPHALAVIQEVFAAGACQRGGTSQIRSCPAATAVVNRTQARGATDHENQLTGLGTVMVSGRLRATTDNRSDRGDEKLGSFSDLRGRSESVEWRHGPEVRAPRPTYVLR